MIESTRRPQRTSSMRLIIVAVAGVVLTAACHPTMQPAPNAGGGTTNTIVSTEHVADTLGILADPASFDNAPGHRWEGNLQCDDISQCNGQSEVPFVIQPRLNSHQIDQKKMLQETGGAWVAKLTNQSNYDYGPWGIGAHKTVFLYVGRVANDSRISTITAGPNSKLLAIAGTVRRCEAQSSSAQADVRTPLHCGPDTEVLFPVGGKAGTDAKELQSKPGFAMFASNRLAAAVPLSINSQGVWISCTGGCCEASRFQLQ